jgi:hypothetical protein
MIVFHNNFKRYPEYEYQKISISTNWLFYFIGQDNIETGIILNGNINIEGFMFYAWGCLKSRTKTKSLAFCRRKMLLKRPKRPAFGYRFALLTQIRDFLDSPMRSTHAAGSRGFLRFVFSILQGNAVCKV